MTVLRMPFNIIFSSRGSVVLCLQLRNINKILCKLYKIFRFKYRFTQFPYFLQSLFCSQEIAAILISFEKHNEWLSKEVKIR